MLVRRVSVGVSLGVCGVGLLLARPLLAAPQAVPKPKQVLPEATQARDLMKVTKAGETPTATTTPSGGRFDVLPNASGPVVRDNDTGRMWERVPGAGKYTFAAAKAMCDAKSLGGYTDWRLARIEELDALLPLPAAHPFTLSGYERWSSTEVSATGAYYTLTLNGNLFVGTRATEYAAWCVRGGGNTAYPNSNPRFVVDGMNVTDTQTGRVWKRAPTGVGSWLSARKECLGHGAGWRLPTQAELTGLLDMSAPESPKLPVGHPFLNAWAPYDARKTWALDTTSVSVAKTVRFSDGDTGTADKSAPDIGSRCIKMDLTATWPAGPVGRFTLQAGDAAVLDQETRLLWERAPVTTGVQYPDALAACTGKSIGGIGGWRLPTLDELSTLIDRNITSGVKLPAGHPFVGVVTGDYWSSTMQTSGSDMMTLDLGNGQTGHMSKMGGHLVGWCVRVAP